MVAAYILSITCNLVRIALALTKSNWIWRFSVQGLELSMFGVLGFGKYIIASRGVKLYVSIEALRWRFAFGTSYAAASCCNESEHCSTTLR